jgi:hypothetical protein
MRSGATGGAGAGAAMRSGAICGAGAGACLVLGRYNEGWC